MTITTRSKRTSLFSNTLTPAAVGPGSYAPEPTSFNDATRPQFSGFAASQKRDLNANKTTSAITPGPGAYISEDDRLAARVPSNVFATKVRSRCSALSVSGLIAWALEVDLALCTECSRLHDLPLVVNPG